MPDALHDLSALEQAAAIAQGNTSAEKLTDHYLRRSEELGPMVGAFVRLTAELALAQAREVDAMVRAGSQLPSPLAGVVCPVKDLDLVAGVPTSFGSAALEIVPQSSANVVAAMQRAGLVCTGKTTTPEFGLPCYTEPDGLPPARSPWDLNRTAAGSSGGAAAAVAAGLAPIAQGSDGGGSVRLPAAACGLVGIKTSRGRVSNGPAGDALGDLVGYGPLARTVADAAALLDVMSVPFPGDPFRAPLPQQPFLSAAATPPPRLRIGWYTDPVIGQTPPTGEVVKAMADTVALLADLGHEVVEMPAPMDHRSVEVFEVLWWALADSVPLPPEMEAQLTALTRWQRQSSRQHSAGQLAAAAQEARRLAREAAIATARYDVVLSPTANAAPFEVGSMRNDDDPAADFHAQKQWSSYTAVYNLTGQPSINVPLNWTDAGIPIGVQFAAAWGEEAVLISLAAELEGERPWRHRRPSMW